MVFGRDLFGEEQSVAPSVFDGSTMDQEEEFEDEDEELPPQEPSSPPAFIPSENPSQPESNVTLQLRQSEDGKLVLPVFTSLELLVSCFGEAQPWVCVPQDEIDNVKRACEAELVLWDPIRPSEDKNP